MFFIAGVAAVTTVGRRSGRPGSTAAAWAVVILAAGALGYGTGQRKVSAWVNQQSHHHAQGAAPSGEQPPPSDQRLAILSEGTGEAAANYVLAGVCALLVSALGGVLVFFRRDRTAAVAAAPTGQPARAG
jgi:hypothetical protein